MKKQTEFYKKIYIKSEADLPKERQLVFHRNNDGLIKESEFREKYKDEWLSIVDWYLKPVKLDMPTEEEIIKKGEDYCMFAGKDGEPEADQHAFYCFLDGAKWVINYGKEKEASDKT
jgi:hypothetical protein